MYQATDVGEGDKERLVKEVSFDGAEHNQGTEKTETASTCNTRKLTCFSWLRRDPTRLYK